MTTTHAPLGEVQPGRDGGLVAEVARQVDEDEARVFPAGAAQQGERAVAAAVVHEDDLATAFDLRQSRAQALDEGGQNLLLVEHGKDDGDLWPWAFLGGDCRLSRLLWHGFPERDSRTAGRLFYLRARATKKMPPQECQTPRLRMKPATALPKGPNS